MSRVARSSPIRQVNYYHFAKQAIRVAGRLLERLLRGPNPLVRHINMIGVQ